MMVGSNAYSLNVLFNNQVIADLSFDPDTDNFHFVYQPQWKLQGFALSPHLPLEGIIQSSAIRRYLQNLLPENQGLDHLIDYLAVSKQNTFALIHGIGQDTSGAVLFVRQDESIESKTEFRPITTPELVQRLADPSLFAMEVWDDKPRLSVAGVQSKINVLQLNGEFGFGSGDLCSTHIIKFEKSTQQHLVINEFVTMKLAQLIGLPTANVELHYFDQYPTLVVERFDRKLVNGVVKRKHLIDACQACNLGVDRKYERNLGKQRDVAHIRDGVSLKRLFELTQVCQNPIAAKLTLLNWVLFNLCVFNHDAHGKNMSFFVSKSGLEPTPLYDLVNVQMYPEFEQELAMAIGDEFEPHAINAYQLMEFADECQINSKLLMRQLQKIAKSITEQLSSAIGLLGELSLAQQTYMAKYHQQVEKRCQHFIEQAQEIPKITL
ncbi:HipA domain-containing protein [Shewanella youngdeokensis]|uniref:HipA domain-containing protein n=1 Tax=Shewanella youngdeokensis TaxID=2999068 RepID=A0ABZ0K236_9GAMM|nr:HipA domain-containing protein [Shewanella sp. DAU334]